MQQTIIPHCKIQKKCNRVKIRGGLFPDLSRFLTIQFPAGRGKTYRWEYSPG